MNPPDWIAVDWGTTRLRAWSMTTAGEIVDRADSDCGMSTLSPADYEPALLSLIEPWLAVDRKLSVVACGMVGSQQGWIEVPYVEAPCRPLAEICAAPVASDRIAVGICPGVKQVSPSFDVMRGEETQIAGLLAQFPEFDGVVCLPGTHSKWVRVAGGKIDIFQTFLTGELFALLADHSVLRHSVAGVGSRWSEGAFLDGLAHALDAPASISAKLFSLRAEALLDALDGVTARARLSGYLIGLELAGARAFWSGADEVALIGEPGLSGVYRASLRHQGVSAASHDVDAMTVAGLHATHARWHS